MKKQSVPISKTNETNVNQVVLYGTYLELQILEKFSVKEILQTAVKILLQ